MRHRSKKITLDRKSGPRKHLLRNLATQMILYEKITTTEAKAKAVKPIVERLITVGKKNDLTSRRRLLAALTVDSAVNKVLQELGPRYITRPGGYTRVIKMNQRQGDAAKMAQLRFV